MKTASKRDEEKARWERKILTEFAEAAKLEIVSDSIRSEIPPRPDTSCVIAGQKHYFELREITDQELARRYSISIKTMQQTGGSYSQDDPLIRTFSSKLQKNYRDLDGPLELLAYYEKQCPPPELKDSTKETLFWTIQSMLIGQWYRVWIYSTRKREVLCRYRLEDLIGT
jgi:hypothetical protein